MSELFPARLDLTDPEIVKDAEAHLTRAEGGGETELAAWARQWGRPALVALTELHDAADGLSDWDEGD